MVCHVDNGRVISGKPRGRSGGDLTRVGRHVHGTCEEKLCLWRGVLVIE